MVFGFLFALACVIRLKKTTKAKFVWKPLLAVALCVCVLCDGLAPLMPSGVRQMWRTSKHREAAPTGRSVYTEKQTELVDNADLYLASVFDGIPGFGQLPINEIGRY